MQVSSRLPGQANDRYPAFQSPYDTYQKEKGRIWVRATCRRRRWGWKIVSLTIDSHNAKERESPRVICANLNPTSSIPDSPHDALSKCWASPDTRVNCRSHFGHTNSSSSWTGEFKCASSEYDDRNVLLQVWHWYPLPSNAIWSWEAWYVIRERGGAGTEPSIAGRREIGGFILRAWTAAVIWCLVIESWLQWPSTCCASPEGVLNLEGQEPMQGIDLGLCTGDALCYEKYYEHRQLRYLV